MNRPLVDDSRVTSVDLMLQGGLFLLVASIPFEYPERTIPLEIPTITGAVFLLLTLLHPRKCYGRLPGAVLWFALYLLVFLLSMIAGGSHTGDAISEFVVILQGILVLLAAGNLMQEERVATRAMVTLVAACAARAALPLLGLARTTSTVWTGGERVSALGQNANSAAMILAAGMVALIGLAYGYRARGWLRLFLAGALGALLGFAILETGSRGGLAALLGGVLIFAFAADTLRTRLRNATIATIAVALLIYGTLHLPVMKNRLEDSMRTGNMAGRELLYPTLWGMFLEKPALGWGPATNTYELALRIGEREREHRAAHNIVLELLTASGLFGAIPFLAGMWLCARSAWRARRGSHGVLPLALVCSVFISNMSGDWIASKLIWVVLAYGLASSAWEAVPLRIRATPAGRLARIPVTARPFAAGGF
jgi:O-antigen ligase